MSQHNADGAHSTNCESISSEYSFTIRNIYNSVDIIFGLWLIVGGLGVVVVTFWWSIDDEWNADITPYYYVILIVFHLTISFICLSFVVQYYVLPAGLPKIYSHIHKQEVPVNKHRQNVAANKMPILLSEKKKNNAKQALLREKKLKRTKDPQQTHFYLRRCSLILSPILTANLTLFNFSSICVMIFHLLYVIVLIISLYYKFETDTILEILCHSIRSISEVLPGICLILYWKARETYDPYEKYIKKYEKKLLSLDNNILQNREESEPSTTTRMANEFKYKEHTKTLAATNSLFSHVFIRAWLLCALSFCLLYFLLYPFIQNELFQRMRNEYQRVESITFVINMCILRPFVGIVLSRSMFLTFRVTETPKLQGIKSFLSITIIGIIVFFECTDLIFWNHENVHFTLSIVWSFIYIVTFVWCLLILQKLMVLAKHAKRDWEKWYGFQKKESWTPWFEGLLILTIFLLYGTFSFLSGQTVISHIRDICTVLFNGVQIAILYPLHSIETIPEIRKYVAKKKKKYIHTFKWISVLNIVAFFYFFIYASNEFYHLLNDEEKSKDAYYLLSYTFSFCMPYYHLWAIEQFDKWLKFNINDSVHGSDRRISIESPKKHRSVFINGDANDNDNGDGEIKLQVAESVHIQKTNTNTLNTIQRHTLRRLSEGNSPLSNKSSLPNSALLSSLNYDGTMEQFQTKNESELHVQDDSI